MTERDLLNMLHRRYGEVANNDPTLPMERRARRYVVAEHVPVQPFGAAQILDAVVVDTRRSGALAAHGFEVKCSRSDWLAELRRPEKAAAWAKHLHCFWLVISDAGVLRDLDEAPHDWGVLRAAGDRLVVDRQPRVQPAPQMMPWEMTVALLRAAARTERVGLHRTATALDRRRSR